MHQVAERWSEYARQHSVGVNTLSSRVNALGIHYASEVDKYRPSAYF